MTFWYNKIIAGEKVWKYIGTDIKHNIVNKIILVRACTPDEDSNVVSGALILGPWDPNASKDEAMRGNGSGHPILLFIPFSIHRHFECKTVAGCYPKRA